MHLFSRLQKKLNRRLQQQRCLKRQQLKMQRLITTISDQRKSHNRTKIQLGGLVIKAGLTELLGIKLGEDLQLDAAAWDKATTLLGGFIELYQHINDDPDLQHQWRILGNKAMQRHYLTDKYQV